MAQTCMATRGTTNCIYFIDDVTADGGIQMNYETYRAKIYITNL